MAAVPKPNKCSVLKAMTPSPMPSLSVSFLHYDVRQNKMCREDTGITNKEGQDS